MNGCFNRDPLNDIAVVQAGWIDGFNHETQSYTRYPNMIVIADPMTKDCQYSKLHNDPKCLNCKWKI